MQQLRFAQPTGRAFCGRGGFLPAAVPHPRPPAALQPSGWRAAVAAPLPERRPAASPAATAADTLQQQQTQEAQCGDGETYGRALELARAGDYAAARAAFSEALACQPRLCKAWVSWAQARCPCGGAAPARAAAALPAHFLRPPHAANPPRTPLSPPTKKQMEKRAVDGAAGLNRCRATLQRGLALNPGSACLVQAWGLLELQRGNNRAALKMLDRCCALDTACAPVLKWQHVQRARQAMGALGGAPAVGRWPAPSAP